MAPIGSTGVSGRRAKSVLITIAFFFVTILQNPAMAGIGSPDTECQNNGFDFGIERWSWPPSDDGWVLSDSGSAAADYEITVEGTAVIARWTSSPAVDGVLAKAGSGPSGGGTVVLPGGITGTITVADLPGLGGHALSHITFCGNEASLIPVTASASPGTCLFVDGVSSTPVTASIAPPEGATLALSLTGTGLVHTFPTDGATYPAAPGDYTWLTTVLDGFVINGLLTGGFTTLSCVPPRDLISVTALATPGTCLLSITAVTASINPPEGATLALSLTGTGLVHTFPTDGATYNAAPGDYTWLTTVLDGFVINGLLTGGFTTLACTPIELDPVVASASPGTCAFANGLSSTPVTASINPPAGATLALSLTGTGLVHTFPTNGATFSAAPGTYTWLTTAAGGFEISGSSTGGFTTLACPPATQVLGVVITPAVVTPAVVTPAVQVLGVQVAKALPNTGPGIPVPQSAALALAAILLGVALNSAGNRRVRTVYTPKHLAPHEWEWSFTPRR